MGGTVEQIREWLDEIPVNEDIGPFSHIWPGGKKGAEVGAVAWCGFVRREPWTGLRMEDAEARGVRFCKACLRSRELAKGLV